MEACIFIAADEEQARQFVLVAKPRMPVKNERGAIIGTVERLWADGCKVMAMLDCAYDESNHGIFR